MNIEKKPWNGIFYKLSEIKVPNNIKVVIFKPTKKEQIFIIKGKFGQYKLKNVVGTIPVNVSDQKEKDLQRLATKAVKLYQEDADDANETQASFALLNTILQYDTNKDEFFDFDGAGHFIFDNNKIQDVPILSPQTYLWPLLMSNEKHEKIVPGTEKFYFGYLLTWCQQKDSSFVSQGLTLDPVKNIQPDTLDPVSPGFLRTFKNVVTGLSEGYSMNLELNGVGYACEITEKVDNGDMNSQSVSSWRQHMLSIMSSDAFRISNSFEQSWKKQGEYRNQDLALKLGASHTIFYHIPKTVKITIGTSSKSSSNISNIVTVFGVSKEIVNSVAATIYQLKKPEPYKGKGIRYDGEKLFMKSSTRSGSSEKKK